MVYKKLDSAEGKMKFARWTILRGSGFGGFVRTRDDFLFADHQNGKRARYRCTLRAAAPA